MMYLLRVKLPDAVNAGVFAVFKFQEITARLCGVAVAVDSDLTVSASGATNTGFTVVKFDQMTSAPFNRGLSRSLQAKFLNETVPKGKRILICL